MTLINAVINESQVLRVHNTHFPQGSPDSVRAADSPTQNGVLSRAEWRGSAGRALEYIAPAKIHRRSAKTELPAQEFYSAPVSANI